MNHCIFLGKYTLLKLKVVNKFRQTLKICHFFQYELRAMMHWAMPCRLASAPNVSYYTSLWGPQSPRIKEGVKGKRPMIQYAQKYMN